MKKRILLLGPFLGDLAYGSGAGGYSRNMQQYLNCFKSNEFEIIPCFHTVRGQSKYSPFAWRFIKDTLSFIAGINKHRPHFVHILAQYRTAIPREFMAVLLSNILRIPVVYEIKAGAFQVWYSTTALPFRWMTQYCVSNSRALLCEGIPYIQFIKNEFSKEGFFFPNFVSLEEIPGFIKEKLTEEKLRVLFVGYAYSGKGVFELIKGCQKASKEIPIEVTLVGNEHPDFAAWLDKQSLGGQMEVQRLGLQPHGAVLEHYGKNDIYCYPSRHSGEGHSNSINEAMMYGMTIITSRQGFAESILSSDTAYFLDAIDPDEIASVLLRIANNRQEACKKGMKAQQRLIEHFTADTAFEKLHDIYRRLCH